MTAQQWQRVRDLFEQAIDHDPSDVRRWLASQAGDDPAVAAEAASLLEHHSRAGSFLAEPVADRVPSLFEEGTRFEPGTVIGSYTVVREVDRGGMGRVYQATDARLGRTVALKVLDPSLTRDPSQRERLRREARAAAGLTHPGICTIYALEEIGDDVFIAAEFIDGHTLRAEIAGGERPTASMLLNSARELAEALACAHGKGITHRDLKPENVMRNREGRLKILDFGLALVSTGPNALDALPRVTLPGAIVGTPAYMAPEQLKGGSIDARTDVFAYGILIYEYATGVHPFDASTPRRLADRTPLVLAARILEVEPRSIQEVRADVPRQIVSVVERSLQKLPAARFNSAAEIIPLLTDAPSPPEPLRVTDWWRNHQMIALGLYFVAAALAWQIKEWQHGLADSGFLAVAVLATTAGIFRGHLLFTERLNRPSFDAERRRAEPITLVTDVVIALALAAEGWQLAAARPLAGALTIALAVGIALTRLVVEPSTARGAFG
jgi:serine/threonine protein kinase